MKINKNLYSVALVSVTLILYLTIISSTALADTEQTASSAGAYAYITNYDDQTVSVINTATNTVTATVPVGRDPYGIAVSPDGTKAYVTNQAINTVSIIDIPTNKVTSKVKVGNYPWGIAVNPAGTKVYVANCDSNTVSVIDTATNTVKATVSVGKWPAGVAVNPSGTKVYVTNILSNDLSIIDATTNTVKTTVSLGSNSEGVAVSPDEKKVYVTKATVSLGSNPEGVAVSPDGKNIYVTNRGSSTVSVIDTAKNTVTATIPVGGYPQGVTVTPNGKYVYVTNGGSNTVSVIDIAKNKVTSTVSVGNYPLGVAISLDGKKVYVTNGDSNTVSIIDTATNKVTATVSVGRRPIAFGQFIGSSTSEPPIASFSSNVTEGYAPLSVKFIDNSQNAIGWSWKFGDGATSTDPSPVHTYSAPGTYTVTLTVTNTAGKDTEEDYITVNSGPDPTKPVANFSASPVSGDKPLKVDFTDTSTGNINSWDWEFGDGVHSNARNPTHTYGAYGSYTVSLRVMNTSTESQNTTIKSQYINVIAPLVADFVTNVTTGSAPLSVQFTDKSSGKPTSWFWNFGDGATSTEKNPKHTYSKAGKYTVSFTVTNAFGKDTDEETDYITVTPPKKLVADFSANTLYAPLTVAFTDKSTGNPTKWAWDFGDKSVRIKTQNPTHQYSKGGTYTVKLTVTNAAGTTAYKSVKIVVPKVVKPVANFIASPTSGKSSLTVAFTDKSQNTPTSWRWVFGDGKISTEQNPTHQYTKAGTYKVKLTATNAAGSSTVSRDGYIVVS
jgi:YVTN family beta-propeller protein